MELMFSVAFVCLFVSKQDYAKQTTPLIFTKFDRKVADGPRNIRLG